MLRAIDPHVTVTLGGRIRISNYVTHSGLERIKVTRGSVFDMITLTYNINNSYAYLIHIPHFERCI